LVFCRWEKTKINVFEKLPEPESGKEYTITKVEQGKGQFGEYIRVTLKDNEEKEYSTALWIKDTVSAKSKAGAFAIALGNNPEEWEGKRIKIISWTAKNREIQAIETSTTTKKGKWYKWKHNKNKNIKYIEYIEKE